MIMHSCLQIPEILSLFFEYLDIGDSCSTFKLAALARTQCHAFTGYFDLEY
jgi:hypothetical protein